MELFVAEQKQDIVSFAVENGKEDVVEYVLSRASAIDPIPLRLTHTTVQKLFSSRKMAEFGLRILPHADSDLILVWACAASLRNGLLDVANHLEQTYHLQAVPHFHRVVFEALVEAGNRDLAKGFWADALFQAGRSKVFLESLIHDLRMRGWNDWADEASARLRALRVPKDLPVNFWASLRRKLCSR